jgi:hypothetical protein
LDRRPIEILVFICGLCPILDIARDLRLADAAARGALSRAADRIAKALNVTHQCVSKDLRGLQPCCKPSRPKGGRPKTPVLDKAFDLWLAMRTQDEIAKAIGYSRVRTTEFLTTFTGNAGSVVSGKTPDSDDDLHSGGQSHADADADDDEDSNSLERFKLTSP